MHSGGTQLYLVYTHYMITHCECCLVGTMYWVCVCVCVLVCIEQNEVGVPDDLEEKVVRQERACKIIFRSNGPSNQRTRLAM